MSSLRSFAVGSHTAESRQCSSSAADASSSQGDQVPKNEAGEFEPSKFRRRLSFPKETWVAIAALGGIVLYLITRYAVSATARYSHWILLFVLLLGGVPLVIDLVVKAFCGEFGSDLLAGLSIVTSAAIGEYLAGSIVVLMLSGGTALEQYATRRASAVLGALAKRLPSIARRRSSSQTTEISLQEVQVGDELVVFPHEICPVDGVIIEGRGTMDESYLTGEPVHGEFIDQAAMGVAYNPRQCFCHR